MVDGLDSPGVIENSLIKYILPLKNKGIEMAVVSSGGGRYADQLVDIGTEVFYPDKNIKGIRSQGKESWISLVKKTIQKYNPDILYAHQMETTLSIVPLESGVPVASAIHSRFIDLADQETLVTIKSATGKIASFHALGRVIEKELRSVGAKNIISIFSPVPQSQLEASPRISPDRPKLVFVGRPDNRKGLDVLIKALPLIKDTFPEARLTVLGNDGETKRLVGGGYDRPEAVRLGVDSMIDWLGTKSHQKTMSLLSKSDLLVSPSRQEGLPSVVLEAHSLALPVVATPASAEAMNSGETGIIVPTDNHFLLAKAIEIDLKDPDRRKRGGKNREWVFSNYSTEKLVDIIERDFKRLVG